MALVIDPHLPPTPELLHGVSVVIARLRGRLVEEIVLPEGPLGLHVPNLVRAYLQGHLRRMLAFLEGGQAEYVAGRPLMTELATRAIYENVATVCDFTDKLKPLCDAVDYAGIEKHVQKATFSTRIPSLLESSGQDLKAPNILSQIDRMMKRYTEFREAYDYLSEIVHPNGLGAVVYFAKMPGTGDRFSFPDSAANTDRSIQSLFIAASLLTFVETEMDATETALKKVVEAMTTKPPA